MMPNSTDEDEIVETETDLLLKYIYIAVDGHLARCKRYCISCEIALAWLKKVLGRKLSYDEETMILRHIPARFLGKLVS